MRFPVFKAFGASIAYIFAHFLTIIKILWLPMLALIAVQIFVMPSMMEAQLQLAAVEETADPSEVFALMGPMMKSVGILNLVALIAYPMMIAGLLRHVIRGDAPSLPFYIGFGADELRIILATILLILMTGIIYAGGFLALMAVGLAISAVASAIGGVIILVGAVVLIGALIWFMVRMSLVYAAGVGEKKIGIAETWNLTKGNFWGLFFYWFLWWIILVGVSIAFMAVVMPGYIPLMMEFVAASADVGADSSVVEDINRRLLEVQASMWDVSNPGAWLQMGVMYLFTMTSIAMWVVPGGVAYRYLQGSERG